MTVWFIQYFYVFYIFCTPHYKINNTEKLREWFLLFVYLYFSHYMSEIFIFMEISCIKFKQKYLNVADMFPKPEINLFKRKTNQNTLFIFSYLSLLTYVTPKNDFILLQIVFLGNLLNSFVSALIMTNISEGRVNIIVSLSQT